MKEHGASFQPERLIVPLSRLLPVRHLEDPEKTTRRYRMIVSSISDAGMIEPLMVFPQSGKTGTYLIMDGHLRFHALRELGVEEAECLVANDDESFTYNARINRLSPIQEHAMIARAVKGGLSVERIARALDKDVKTIRARLNLLRGVHEEVVELLKDKQVSEAVFKVLRRVKPARQIEIVKLLAGANNFTKGYVEGLFMATPKDQLTHPNKPKTKMIAPEDQARMEAEMQVLERDFKAIESAYSENMLHSTVIRGYLRTLLANSRVARFVAIRYPDLSPELTRLASRDGA